MTSTPFRQLQEDQGSSPTRVDSPIFFGASDPVFLADPYPLYARIRAADPVHRTPHGLWILTRYADAAAVLRDPRFGREGFERHFGTGGGPTTNGACSDAPPPGVHKVEGQDEIYPIYVGRGWRVLYSVEAGKGDLVIEAVRRKPSPGYRFGLAATGQPSASRSALPGP